MVLLKNEEEWNVAVADMAKNTFNPIRNILETMNIQPHPDKPMISLSIGDPTIFGNLNPSSNAITAITEALQSGKYNGLGINTKEYNLLPLKGWECDLEHMEAMIDENT